MFASMMQVESTKLFRRKILWVEMTISGMLIALMLVALIGATYANLPEGAEVRGTLLWPSGMMAGGSLAASNQMGALMILVLVSALYTQEYGWGTLALLFSRGVSRSMVFITKLAAIVLAAAILALVTVVLGAGASLLFTVITGQELTLLGSDLMLALGLFVGTVLSLLPFIGLTILLSVLSRSAVTSIGVGIGFLLAERIISQVFNALGGILAQSTLYFPMALGQEFLAAIHPSAQTAGLLSAPVAALLLVAYGAGFSALALWSLMKQDLTA